MIPGNWQTGMIVTDDAGTTRYYRDGNLVLIVGRDTTPDLTLLYSDVGVPNVTLQTAPKLDIGPVNRAGKRHGQDRGKRYWLPESERRR